MGNHPQGQASSHHEFAKWKSEVRESILADPKLSATSKLLAGAVLERIYSRSGFCGSSVDELRQAIGSSRRGVQRAFGELAETGHFVVARGTRGKTTTNRIGLTLEARHNDADEERQNDARSVMGGAGCVTGDALPQLKTKEADVVDDAASPRLQWLYEAIVNGEFHVTEVEAIVYAAEEELVNQSNLEWEEETLDDFHRRQAVLDEAYLAARGLS